MDDKYGWTVTCRQLGTVWQGGQVLKGTAVDNWQQGRLGERYVDKPFRMGKDFEDICVPGECPLQSVVTAEEAHGNQAKKMTCSVGVSQSFSPATRAIAH